LNLVDLHTHTTESDGTLTPEQLLRAAAAAGVRTLAITDHDTVYHTVRLGPHARRAGIELIEGIELSTTYAGRTVHLLGYFIGRPCPPSFRAWLDGIHESRRDRNRRLASRLRQLGLDITVEEAAHYGAGLTGRPHFARVLVQKGYVTSLHEAFDRYLGEAAPGYVERDAPNVPLAIERLRAAGAVSSLAHPVRVEARDSRQQERAIAEFARAGLDALEAYHPDHTADDTERFLRLAREHGMTVTGGSDFHGDNKPGVEVGGGVKNGLRIPDWVMPALRARCH
jgi:3',5'-nucleoside bisphosphate phosphatase